MSDAVWLPFQTETEYQRTKNSLSGQPSDLLNPKRTPRWKILVIFILADKC